MRKHVKIRPNLASGQTLSFQAIQHEEAKIEKSGQERSIWQPWCRRRGMDGDLRLWNPKNPIRLQLQRQFSTILLRYLEKDQVMISLKWHF